MPKVQYVNTIRTFDKEGFKKRAGCLCFKSEAENEVLLVSSSKVPNKWVVPSGGVEPNEDLQTAALREVAEEAGVKGTLGRFLGTFELLKNLKSGTKESVERIRKWFTVDSASKLLRECKPFQACYIDKAVKTRLGCG